jgi:ribosomal protein S12 methylthiotransferase accessory factor YcaO
MKPKQRTNVQFIRHLMEYSRHGALMQALVLEAIERYATQCAQADAQTFDASLLSGAAWRGCAVEVVEGLRQHYGRPDSKPACQ